MIGMLALVTACIGNRRPKALFSVSLIDGPSPLTVDFDGSLSYDPDGEIVAYEWDFGDDTTGSGEYISHTFSSSSDREFRVRLTVTDDEGATDTHRGWVTVYGSDKELGEVLFFDDFEDGMDPAWQTSPGWYVSDGVLHSRTFSGSPKAYVLTGTDWTDYVVDVDLNPGAVTAAVILRSQEDLRNRVELRGSHEGIGWVVFVDNEQVRDEAVSPGLFEGLQHVEITVSGSTYEIRVEGLLRSTFEDDTFSRGMPGLTTHWQAVFDEPYFDNFRVTALE